MWFWKVHGVNFNNETFSVTAGIPAWRWTSEKASYSCLYVRHRELWENDYRFPWPLKYQHTHRHSLQTHTDLPEAAMLHNHSLFFVWSDCNFSHLCSTQKEKGKKNDVLSVYPRAGGKKQRRRCEGDKLMSSLQEMTALLEKWRTVRGEKHLVRGRQSLERGRKKTREGDKDKSCIKYDVEESWVVCLLGDLKNK